MSSEVTKFPKILILLLMFTFGNFLAVFITPALPELSHDFGISSSLISWVMTIYLIGYCFGQLPYGPLANRFGRKGAFTIGIIIALLGTVIAAFSHSFSLLCLARFLQAVGASAGLKVVFTMIGDLHTGDKAAKTIAILSLAFGFGPALATAIGGYVTTYAGWRGCFIFLIFYTIILWFAARVLPETAKEIKKDALQGKEIVRGYLGQFKDTYVVMHAVLAGLTTSSFYIFATLSPHLAMSRIGLTPDQFGLWSMVPSLGLFIGAICSARLSSTNPRIVMLSGILIYILSISTLTVLFANGIVTVWSLFLPPFFMYLGNNLTWSRALAQGLSGANDKSNASAVMQFINLGIAMVGVFWMQIVPPTTTMLLPTAFGIIALLLLVLWLKLKTRSR